MIDDNSMATIGLADPDCCDSMAFDEASLQTVSVAASQNSPLSARKHYTFTATSAIKANKTAGSASGGNVDESVVYLRQQLDEERKKHKEMKKMFEDTIQTMEEQSKALPK